tara:strand:- start:1594 stop:2457 length:864 start_codon:yes stop_codon:yes gene_type:complete
MDLEKNALEKLVSTNTKQIKPKSIGWTIIEKSDLAYDGKYYPTNAIIEIEKMSIKSLKWISSIDFDNILDVNRMFNYIVSEHCRVVIGNQKFSGEQIFAIDRTHIIMAIRELNQFGTDIPFEATCGHKSCGHKNKYNLDKNLTSFTDNHIDKYYNGNIFCIDAEGFESSWYYMPPTILEVNEVSEFVVAKIKKGTDKEIATTFIKMFSFLREDPTIKDAKNSFKSYWTRYVKLNPNALEEINFLTSYTLEGTEEGSLECNKCRKTFRGKISPTDFSNFAKSSRVFKI